MIIISANYTNYTSKLVGDTLIALHIPQSRVDGIAQYILAIIFEV